jgi:hypothetical protein
VLHPECWQPESLCPPACQPACQPALPCLPIRSACLCLQTTVSGNYPGNTANLASNVAVCASQVYVVDKVGGVGYREG